MKSSLEALNTKAQAIGQAIYAQAQAEQAAQAESAPSGDAGEKPAGGDDDDVIDAEVVDDDK